MTVKIVTDSLSDITKDISKGLDITVVPLTVLFGHETYLDRVTISPENFYKRLVTDSVWPTTTQPTPAAFAEVYNKLSEDTDEILVVVLSSKMSGTYQSATSAKNMVKKKVRIEVIDSQLVVMALGLVVLAAAKEAKKGAKLDSLVTYTKKAITRSHMMVYFDTLKYLAKGGRIGKAQGFVGSLLSVKPILNMKEGEMAPITRVRSQAAGMDYLYNYAASVSKIEALAVEYTSDINPANKLAERIGAIYPQDKIVRSVVSPVAGVYGGPGAVAVSVLEAEK